MHYLDLSCLEIFLKNLAVFYIGSDVLLSNGETGKIVYIPPQNIINPIVSVGTNYIDLSEEPSLKILRLL